MNNQIANLDQKDFPLSVEKPQIEEMNDFEKGLYIEGEMKFPLNNIKYLQKAATALEDSEDRTLLEQEIAWFSIMEGRAPNSWISSHNVAITITSATRYGIQLHDNLINMALVYPNRDLICRVGTMQKLNGEQMEYLERLVGSDRVSKMSTSDLNLIRKAQQGLGLWNVGGLSRQG